MENEYVANALAVLYDIDLKLLLTEKGEFCLTFSQYFINKLLYHFWVYSSISSYRNNYVLSFILPVSITAEINIFQDK